MNSILNSSATSILTDEFFICPACQKEFIAPKLLPCFHSFCQECLEHNLKNNNIHPGQAFYCPICHTKCPIPVKGVSYINNNFLVDAALKFFRYRNESISDPKSYRICDSCLNRNSKLKCLQCDQWLCNSCCKVHTLVKSSKSHNLISPYDLVSGRFDDVIKNISSSVYCILHDAPYTWVGSDSRGIRILLCDMCKMTANISYINFVEVKNEANVEFKQIEKLLLKLPEVISSFSKRLTNLQRNEVQLKQNSRQIERSINHQAVLIIENLTHVLLEYAQTLHETIDKVIDDRLKTISHSIDTNHCDFERAKIAEQFAKAIIELNLPRDTIRLKTQICEALLPYQFKVRTKLPKLSKLQIKPSTQLKMEEYFGRIIFDDDESLDKSISKFTVHAGYELEPLIIDFLMDGQYLYVVDAANKLVKCFSEAGETQYATEVGKLISPTRIALLRRKRSLLINDNKILKVVSNRGTTINIFTKVELKYPIAIIVSLFEEVFVSDGITGEVKTFDENGIFVRSFASSCQSPWYMSISEKTNTLAISDFKCNAIIIFDLKGNCIGKYFDDNRETGLDHPHGLSIDSEGKIYICDTRNNRIVVISRVGEWLGVYLDNSLGLKWPHGLAFYRKDRIIVAEMKGLIKVFDIKK